MEYYNTKVFKHDNRQFCGYCGKIIEKPQIQYYGNHGRDEDYYGMCSCEGAMKEIEYQKAKNIIENEERIKIHKLGMSSGVQEMELKVKEKQDAIYAYELKKLKERYDK